MLGSHKAFMSQLRRSRINRRHRAAMAQENAIALAGTELSKGNDFSVKLTDGRVYEELEFHSHLPGSLGAASTPALLGWDRVASVPVGPGVVASHCLHTGHSRSIGVRCLSC